MQLFAVCPPPLFSPCVLCTGTQPIKQQLRRPRELLSDWCCCSRFSTLHTWILLLQGREPVPRMHSRVLVKVPPGLEQPKGPCLARKTQAQGCCSFCL